MVMSICFGRLLFSFRMAGLGFWGGVDGEWKVGFYRERECGVVKVSAVSVKEKTKSSFNSLPFSIIFYFGTKIKKGAPP